MASVDPHPALGRVIGEPGSPGARALDLLGDGLSGADLTTLLLAVARRRVADRTPADVLRQYRHDRFVRPAATDFGALRAAEDLALGLLPAGFEPITLAPVMPLGTHAVLGDVDQNNVVSTMRATEVTADPTTSLALEAAERRRSLLADDPRSTASVRLAAVHRVLRAQQFSGGLAFAHFGILGLVTAGRDRGNLAFEREAAVEHLRYLVDVLLAAGTPRIRVECTELASHLGDVTGEIRHSLGAVQRVEVVEAPERTAGRRYYATYCIRLFAELDGELVDLADGGTIGWTQQLVGSAKERLWISGIGLDRLAAITAGRPSGARRTTSRPAT